MHSGLSGDYENICQVMYTSVTGFFSQTKYNKTHVKIVFKIEYHAVGDTWWQPLLSYGK